MSIRLARVLKGRFAMLTVLAAVLAATDVSAADQWIEVKSAHFTLVSNAGEATTRRLAWQLEQVRAATAALWSWAKPDLNKPLRVIALKDENSMRALAPEYWQTRRAVHPASLWVTAPDEHYLAIRTDVEVESRGYINPYLTAYESYISLVLHQSVDRELPLWFSRGFTGVLSNTIVNDDHILIGAPLPWRIQVMRERPLLLLPELLKVTRESPVVNESNRREVFDAQTWALVHFLMFGDNGSRSAKLNAYSKMVSTGADPQTAFTEAIGPVEALEGPYRSYVQREIFSYRRFNIDVSVERERFPVRTLTPAESTSLRALFYAATGRAVESRAAIAEARKADPDNAASFTAEGLLFDREKNPDGARAAYTKATGLGTTSAYAYYRLASLSWQPMPSRETLDGIEKQLTKAVGLNTRYADAYAWLGEVRVALGNDSGIGLIRRAIAIEPGDARHRLRAARVMLRQGKPDEARRDAEAALTLADNDEDRREAQELLTQSRKSGQ